MSRVLSVLIAVLVLAGAAFWLVTPARTGRGGRAQDAEAAAAAARREEALLAASEAARPDAERAATDAPSGPAPRREAATVREAELARAQWIDGRVLFPAGTPADEAVFVTANGKQFEDGENHRVAVARDGSFRVAFSEKTRTGRFELEARYLYLDHIERWKSAESDGKVVLAPELGTRIAGRVRLPAGADAASVGGELELQRRRRAGDTFDVEGGRGQHELAQGLEFLFDALPPARDPDLVYELSYDGEAFLGRATKLVAEAGKTLEVELALRPGTVLAGTVRDEDGRPLEKASIQVTVRSGSPWTSAHHREGTSAADGSFRLGAFAGGEIDLDVTLAGFERLRRELGRVEEGRSVTDLALVLTRGSSISGVVRWPDGRPAEAALVLEPHRTTQAWSPAWNEVTGKSDTSGAFAISGLSHESYRVTARGTKTEEVLVKSERTGKERPKKQRAAWMAEVEQVRVGTKDLVLTLSTGLAVTGRAVDDLGVPLADFIVVADRLETDGFDIAGELSRSFRDSDGTFRAEGFAPGEWDVWGLSRAHAPSAPVRVTLPGAAPIVLVVPRGSVLRGRVVDPGGAPLPRASVDVDADDQSRSLAFILDQDVVADEQGLFEIERLGPGQVVLRAQGSTFAPSDPLVLELGAGETRTDVLLRLRPGGTILGEVLGGDARPLADVAVWITDPSGFRANPTSDADGRFRADGVPAGELSVSARTDAGVQFQQSVTLAEGETVRVRLAPAGGAVRLHGLVRAGGEPLPDARVYATRSGEPGAEQARATASGTADESGAYELELPGPGPYRLSVSCSGDVSLAWSVKVDAPAVAELAFDVTVPVGRISGRVTDARGEPLAEVIVHSEPERHEGGSHGWALTRTASDGVYELLVPAGQHAVFAGGSRTWGFVAEGQNHVEARIGGLAVVENGHVRGVDLVLAPGAILAGVVRNADGTAAGRAELYDEGATSLGLSDQNGRFEIPGVAPGTHLIRARARSAATRQALQVELAAGETRRIELVLSPATLVRLTVLQGGVLVGSEIRVLDANGRPQVVETSSENGKATCGPLPPGRYSVSAQRDGKTVAREFEVAGEKELALELVFE